jgi:hypothetical protein
MASSILGAASSRRRDFGNCTAVHIPLVRVNGQPGADSEAIMPLVRVPMAKHLGRVKKIAQYHAAQGRHGSRRLLLLGHRRPAEIPKSRVLDRAPREMKQNPTFTGSGYGIGPEPLSSRS